MRVYRSTYNQDTHPTGRNDYTSDTALGFVIRHWRPAYFGPMMPAVYQATLERARQRAAAHPRSYLARHLHTLYGVEL